MQIALLFFVHGLTGHQNEHIFYNAARFFPLNGFSTCRFNLYSGEAQGRVLSQTTIKDHVQDLDLVIRYFRQDFMYVALVGHSLGGVVILQSSESANAIILWDSSTKLSNDDGDELFTYSQCLDAYIEHWGTENIISKSMVEEWKNLPEPADLVKNLTQPIKIMCAGKGVLINVGKEYFNAATTLKEFSLIENATHNFNEEGAEEELFKQTLQWLSEKDVMEAKNLLEAVHKPKE